MAKAKLNMSEKIREVLTENPKLTGPEIIEALKAKGLTAKPALVYYVKARFRRRRRRAAAAKLASANGYADPIAVVTKVKALASELGGMAKLKKLVDVLSD